MSEAAEKELSKDPNGLNEREETRYNRDIGTLCRVCGTMTTPTYFGNKQTGHHCSKCGEDFET